MPEVNSVDVCKRRLRIIVADAIIASIMISNYSFGAPLQRNSVTKEDPSQVAIAYTEDLYSGKLDQSRQLVYPEDRPTFDIISAIIQGNRVSAREISVESLSVNGNTALVILEGTFCVGGPAKISSKTNVVPVQQCFTNRDAKSNNQATYVRLMKLQSGKWFVYYPKPK